MHESIQTKKMKTTTMKTTMNESRHNDASKFLEKKRFYFDFDHVVYSVFISLGLLLSWRSCAVRAEKVIRMYFK